MPLFTYTKKQVLYIFYFYLMIPPIFSCGAGTGVHPRNSAQEFVYTRQPNFPETSIHASGPYEKPLLPNDTRLAHPVLSTDIVFSTADLEADTRKIIEPCRASLLKLSEEVSHYWKKEFRIKVLYGYTRASRSGRHLLHMEGRAFDLKLIPAPHSQSMDNKESTHENAHNLQRLAGLAYYRADFSYVEYHPTGNFIHVSCKKHHNSSADYSRCFPGNSFVRDSDNNKILMRDLKIGTRILTMDANGTPTYSDVIMMMHAQTYQKVSDYVRVTSNLGNVLTLSSYHLIHTYENNFIFTKDLKINQSVYTYQNKKFELARVTSIEHVTSIGAYAPLLREGTIVVNDVYTSCYAMFPSHRISHYAFSLWRTIYDYLPSSLAVYGGEYHWYPDFFRRTLNSLSLFPYKF